MLYHLSFFFKSYYSAFNVVHYVSFRVIMGLLTTFGTALILGNLFINRWKTRLAGGSRPWTPETHKEKASRPSMGGLFMIGAILINTLLWNDLTKPVVWLFLASLLTFGAIGGWDDWCKITKKGGISAKVKFRLQLIAAFLCTLLWVYWLQPPTTIVFPFFKSLMPDLGTLLFMGWSMFVLVSMSNAVNVTDGLDGLAISSLIPNFAVFGGLAYVAGHASFSHYLNIPFMPTAELAISCAIMIGSALGFLWYNSYPAEIFMGDVGSLSLGACLAFVALMTKQEMILPIAGILFVVETLSVIMQVFSVKLRGKRLFRMAPIHHHFELIGWPESKIVIRFTILSGIFCLLALITLKLR